MQGSLSIFNPLGLITPVTIQAKILLQELWKQHIDWDEPLEESFQNRWIKIIQEIREATELVIPQRYFTAMQFAVQDLHVFADASTKAYGAVAYFSQDTYTSLVMSKTRVAPLKTISLPRLELMAAVLATRLLHLFFRISSVNVMFIFGLTAKLFYTGLTATKSSNHLSMLVSVKLLAPFLLQIGITVQPLIIQLIY